MNQYDEHLRLANRRAKLKELLGGRGVQVQEAEFSEPLPSS
jgi:hypothetical protein